MNEEQGGVDANKVIDKLSKKNASLSSELAILEVQYDDLLHAYQKQQELVEAYEEKEQLIEEPEEHAPE